MNKFKRKEFKKKEPYLYVAKKDRKKKDNKVELKSVTLGPAGPAIAVAVKPFQDERLDEIVPLLVDMIGKLLSSSGMMRYRSDLIKKTKEIMREKEITKAK